MDKPYATILGKGSKIRTAYLMSGLVETQQKYITVFHGAKPDPDDYHHYPTGYRTDFLKLVRPAVMFHWIFIVTNGDMQKPVIGWNTV